VSKIVDANTEIFEMYGTGEKVKNEDGDSLHPEAMRSWKRKTDPGIY
jgi:hypothetical protein